MNPPPNLPPMIRTDKSNWFGHNTMAVRLPATIDRVVNANPDYPASFQQALMALRDGMADDALIPMIEPLASDYDWWLPAFEAHPGHTWQNTDWFYAETFAYRHVIQATRWWETKRDPFAPIKAEEYAGESLWQLLKSTLAIQGSAEEQLSVTINRTLWGNRIDLSFVESLKRGPKVQAEDLLVDDLAAGTVHLMRTRGEIHIVADNAGTELALDLALVDALLDGVAESVVLHLKTWPTFVSDATVSDVWGFLDLLDKHETETARFGQRLRAAIDRGRLRLMPHLFWNSSYLLWEMPADLEQVLREAGTVIVKGDANYRRMVGDAIWPAHTPFRDVVGYFPAPVLAIRVLKSDAIVGLPAGIAEELDAIDPKWRSNGRRGVIQFKA